MQLSLFGNDVKQQVISDLEQVDGVEVKRLKPSKIHVLSINKKMAAHLLLLGEGKLRVTNAELAEFNLNLSKSFNDMTVSELISKIKHGNEY